MQALTPFHHDNMQKKHADVSFFLFFFYMQHAVVVENYVRKAVVLSVTTTVAYSLSQNPELHFMVK